MKRNDTFSCGLTELKSPFQKKKKRIPHHIYQDWKDYYLGGAEELQKHSIVGSKKNKLPHMVEQAVYCTRETGQCVTGNCQFTYLFAQFFMTQ